MFLSILQCQGCALTAAKMSIELQKVLNDTSGPCAAKSGTLRNETTCVERKKEKSDNPASLQATPSDRNSGSSFLSSGAGLY